MPSNADSLDFSQPKNDLSSIADAERRKLYAEMIMLQIKTFIHQQILTLWQQVMNKEKEQVVT